MLRSPTVALVTGASSGIGFHTAEGLARQGATVYITGRDITRGENAVARIRAATPSGNVHFIRADASTVGGNQRLALRLCSEIDQLHVLVNNVGAAYNDRAETADGYEATLALQFIGPFALTQALLPLLERSVPARIVNIASEAIHMWKGNPFDDIQSTRHYLGSAAYARSKFLNVLWTFALARGLRGRGIVANAIHPGLAWTSLTQGMAPRSMPPWVRSIWPLFRWLQRRGSPEQAARGCIHLASAPEAALRTGTYFGSNAKPGRLPPQLLDVEQQEAAWRTAKQLVANAPTAIALSEVTV